MDLFLARQPILDQDQKVFAYELLFRSGLENYFTGRDQDRATGQVLAHSALAFGLSEVTGGAKAFINFTGRTLAQGLPLALNPARVVVEILETVETTPELVAACRRLKDHGYTLALDDFVSAPEFMPLVELADIVKVDFLATKPVDRRRMAETFLARGIRMLAEKVETQEDVAQAEQWGYTLFQGYYFAKPVVMSQRDLPGFKVHYLQVLQELQAPELDYQRLERLVGGDVSMAYKLLRYINSAAFGLRHQVTSIGQAITLLGERELRNWASLVALSSLGEDKPNELLVNSVVRARFAQLLAAPAKLAPRAADLFLMGLFSMLDALMDRPLDVVLGQVGLEEELRAAILDGRGSLGGVFQLALAHEAGRWEEVSRLCGLLGVDETALPGLYLEAVQYPYQAMME